MKSTLSTVAVLGAAALLAVGCGDSDSDSTSKSGSSDASKAMSTTDVSSTSEAADTRATLDRLLAEHSTLAALATTRALEGAPDAKEAAAALTANGEDLADVIGSVYGDDARDAFLRGWNEHIGYLVDYTLATAGKDNAAKAKAVKDLDGYVQSFGQFLAEATGLPPQAVKDALKAHVQHHAGIIDAYAAGKYAQAYDIERAAYKHMVMIGDTLAGAIAKQQELDNGNATSAAVDTRITLSSLLSEHTELAYVATTSALAGSPDFKAAAGALGKNSGELADVIGSVYGDEAKAAFDTQWQGHINDLVAYTTAAAKKDEAGKEAAVANLDKYVAEFGTFLATATGLPAEDVQNGLSAHIQHHAGSINAFVDGNYAQSYELDRTASNHMWNIGATLTEAIVTQSPEKFEA